MGLLLLLFQLLNYCYWLGRDVHIFGAEEPAGTTTSAACAGDRVWEGNTGGMGKMSITRSSGPGTAQVDWDVVSELGWQMRRPRRLGWQPNQQTPEDTRDCPSFFETACCRDSPPAALAFSVPCVEFAGCHGHTKQKRDVPRPVNKWTLSAVFPESITCSPPQGHEIGRRWMRRCNTEAVLPLATKGLLAALSLP